MTLELLISCMNQTDMKLAEKISAQTPVLLINQTSCSALQEGKRNGHAVRMISTTERGISRSRNMAIQNAVGDICLFCDDDEWLFHDYPQIILNAFKRLADADIIIFNLESHECRLRKTEHLLKFLELLKVSSVQIAFRREAVLNANILFDPLMGAGSGNGAQEENKFLMECYQHGLKIYYVPQIIGQLEENGSTWFQGYDERFFYQRGVATRELLGLPLSIFYAVYYVVKKRKLYSSEISSAIALYSTFRGCIKNDIHRQRRPEKLP